jgi:hypothetical protein
VETGHHSWVDAPDRDSLHAVWIQFHEDLLATLGIERGTDNWREGPAVPLTGRFCRA